MIFNSSYAGQAFAPRGNILSSRYSPMSMPTQSHPCNGMGGEGCECGGSCFERESSTIANKAIHPITISDKLGYLFANDFRILFNNGHPSITFGQGGHPDINILENYYRSGAENSEIAFKHTDLLKVGNKFVVECIYPTGVTEIISSELIDKNLIRVKVDDLRHGNVLEILYYKCSIGWTSESQKSTLPIETNLFQFAIGGWVAMFSIRTTLMSHATSEINNVRISQAPQSGGPPNVGNDFPCIENDFGCPFSKWTSLPIATGYGVGALTFDSATTVYFLGLPCLFEGVGVDISECCKKYALSCYCPSDPWSFDGLSKPNCKPDDFAWCLSKKLISTILEGYSKNILALLCLISMAIITAGASIIAEALSIALIVVSILIEFNSILEIITVFSARVPNSRNASCLCSGKTPTTLCGDECRDVCKEFGKDSECYVCNWKCTYDHSGKFIDLFLKRDPARKLPCCPGSPDPGNTLCGPYYGEEVQKCKKQLCYDCHYKCDISDINNPREYLQSHKSWPCCPGTPRNADPCKKFKDGRFF